MGRISKELKEIVEKREKKEKPPKPWPVLDKDYYLVQIKSGEHAPSGFLQTARLKSYLTVDLVKAQLMMHAAGTAVLGAAFTAPSYYKRWHLYPGPKPNKKWGIVCP